MNTLLSSKYLQNSIYNKCFFRNAKSGKYVIELKVGDDDPKITYQYTFVDKEIPIVFIAYTATGFEVKTKY